MHHSTARFQINYERLDVVPTIKALHAKVRGLAHSEVARTLGQLPHLTPHDRAAIEIMMEAAVKKILHDPTQFLKGDGCHGDRSNSLDVARRLFKLDD